MEYNTFYTCTVCNLTHAIIDNNVVTLHINVISHILLNTRLRFRALNLRIEDVASRSISFTPRGMIPGELHRLSARGGKEINPSLTSN